MVHKVGQSQSLRQWELNEHAVDLFEIDGADLIAHGLDQ